MSTVELIAFEQKLDAALATMQVFQKEKGLKAVVFVSFTSAVRHVVLMFKPFMTLCPRVRPADLSSNNHFVY